MTAARRHAVAIATAMALWAASAQAHERSVSYSTWTLDDDGAGVALRIDSRDLTRLPESALPASTGEDAVSAAVASALVARRGGEPCTTVARVSRTEPAGGRSLLRWRVACPSAGRFEIESHLPERLRAPHLAFVRIEIPGTPGFEVVLHADRALWQQPGEEPASLSSVLADAFRLGIRHIAGGIDHLCFVLGLLLAAATLGEVAIVVTAFTLAHTMTLAAATLGLVRPAAPSIEALIAASIALLAVENLTLRSSASWPSGRHPATAAALVLSPAIAAAAAGVGRVALLALAGVATFALCYLAFAARRPHNRRVRWLVAFVFGLLHGFGFAGVLVESGFSGTTIAATLVAFNAGVEAGQLLFVALLWPLLMLARRRAGAFYARLVLEPASVALLAASVGWYATRAFG